MLEREQPAFVADPEVAEGADAGRSDDTVARDEWG
jgi:hypothetical protein